MNNLTDTANKYKKTLYVSDMDGTLLSSQSVLSPYTIERLNALIQDDGILFTVATARTPATVVSLMQDVNTTIPFITMAGAAWWDNKSKAYSHVQYISNDIVNEVLSIYARYGVHPFVYRQHENVLMVYHDQTYTPEETAFINPRVKGSYKTLVTCPTINANTSDSAVLIYSMGRYDQLIKISDEIRKQCIKCTPVCYHDIYDTTNGILEIYSEGTTKAKAITEMADVLGADRIVVFGDNLNDIPMFMVSTESAAVSNAVNEVKNVADHVIGSNDENAVVDWIAHDIERQKNLTKQSQNATVHKYANLKEWLLSATILIIGLIVAISIYRYRHSNNDVINYISTNAKNMDKVHDEARTIAKEYEWIEGCWLTKDPNVQFSFSIRGGIITITESHDELDSGEYKRQGDTLQYKGYRFILDRSHKRIIMNNGIVFTPAGYYY